MTAKKNLHRVGKTDMPGAIILGGDAQAVGIARGLGPKDIRVIALSWELGIAKFSKYVDVYLRVPPPYEETKFFAALKQIIKDYELDGWVVYPTDDDSVEFIAKFGNELGLVSWGANNSNLRQIVDKDLSAQFAASLGISVPFTCAYDQIDNAENIRFPLIVKPKLKEPFVRLTKKKAIRVDSYDELKKTVAELDKRIPRKRLLIQQLIAGGGESQMSYAGLYKQGSKIAEITACRKRQHPPDFGRASTYVYTVFDKEVQDIGRQVLKSLNYTGLAEVEFKRDQKTNELYFLEINPRTWGWHTIVQKSHGNWMFGCHQIALGMDVRLPETYRDAYWVEFITDIPTVTMEIIKGNQDFSEVIKDYLRTPKAYGTYDHKDILPFIVEWLMVPYLAVIRGF